MVQNSEKSEIIENSEAERIKIAKDAPKIVERMTQAEYQEAIKK